MKALHIWIVGWAMVGMTLGSARNAAAQEPPPSESDPNAVYFTRPVPPPGQVGAPVDVVAGPRAVVRDTLVFMSGIGPESGALVKGAPYSAEAVTEIVQTLGDGNRILRETAVGVHRDSEGRTRRDQTLGAVGPWVASEESVETSFISDPVAGVSYVLNHRTRTARQVPLPRWTFNPVAGPSSFGQIQAGPPETAPSGRMAGMIVRAPGAAGNLTAPVIAMHGAMHGAIHRPEPFSSETREESLGQQLVEGVEAEGTRSVSTIPAGAIGNELPIEIVTERWYAPSLQAVVLSIHNDPRFGRTTYRLSNLRLSEPPPSLFEVPPDYTLLSPPSGITSFEQCAAAGNPVLESSPRQCRTPDGASFTEGQPPRGPAFIWQERREFHAPAAP